MLDRTDVPASHAALFRTWQQLRYQKQYELYGWAPPEPQKPDQIPPLLPDPPVQLAPPGEPPEVEWPDTDPPEFPDYTVTEAAMPGVEELHPFQLSVIPLKPADLAREWDNQWPDLGELPDPIALQYLRELIEAFERWAEGQVRGG